MTERMAVAMKERAERMMTESATPSYDVGPIQSMIDVACCELARSEEAFSNLTVKITPVVAPPLEVKADNGFANPAPMHPDECGSEVRARLFRLVQSLSTLTNRIQDVTARCEI